MYSFIARIPKSCPGAELGRYRLNKWSCDLFKNMQNIPVLETSILANENVRQGFRGAGTIGVKTLELELVSQKVTYNLKFKTECKSASWVLTFQQKVVITYF